MFTWERETVTKWWLFRLSQLVNTHHGFSTFKNLTRRKITSPSGEGNSPMCALVDTDPSERSEESIKDSESGPNGLLAAKRRKFARSPARTKKEGWGRGRGQGEIKRKKKRRIAVPISKRFLCSSDAGSRRSFSRYGRRRSLSRFPREWDNRNTGFCG